MAFRRDTPLVASVERVVQLTGRTDLRNLEASGELDLLDLLWAASNTIHDRLAAQGLNPGQVVNAWVYENAVAWQFLAILAEGHGLGEEDPDALAARADRYFLEVRPELDGAVSPRNAGEGVPEVRNVPGYSRAIWDRRLL